MSRFQIRRDYCRKQINDIKRAYRITVRLPYMFLHNVYAIKHNPVARPKKRNNEEILREYGKFFEHFLWCPTDNIAKVTLDHMAPSAYKTILAEGVENLRHYIALVRRKGTEEENKNGKKFYVQKFAFLLAPTIDRTQRFAPFYSLYELLNAYEHLNPHKAELVAQAKAEVCKAFIHALFEERLQESDKSDYTMFSFLSSAYYWDKPYGLPHPALLDFVHNGMEIQSYAEMNGVSKNNILKNCDNIIEVLGKR